MAVGLLSAETAGDSQVGSAGWGHTLVPQLCMAAWVTLKGPHTQSQDDSETGGRAVSGNKPCLSHQAMPPAATKGFWRGS